MPPQLSCGCTASSQANWKCEGSTWRHGPSAVTWSPIAERIISPAAPPTAPSGESVLTDSRKAMPATASSLTRTYPSTMSIRPSACPAASSTPVPGSRSGCQPNATVPAASDMTGRLTTPRAE